MSQYVCRLHKCISIFTRIDLIYDLYYIWFKLLHLKHILIMIANTYL